MYLDGLPGKSFQRDSNAEEKTKDKMYVTRKMPQYRKILDKTILFQTLL